jgi:hypothetical protein
MRSRKRRAAWRRMSSSSSRALGALLVLCAFAGAAAAQDSASLPAKPTRLFSSDSVLTITIASDIKKYMGTRDSTAPWLPARLILGADTLRIGLRPRGHFRRKSSTCSFPPVSVKFEKDVKGTEFAKQKKLKLVTTCWPGQADYESYIPQEYLLYRVYNLITPVSFRARFVRVTYADTARPDRAPIVTTAFFVEDQDDMAARNAGKIIKAKNAGREDLDAATLADLSLFEFMIGNTDLSFAAEHNIRFVQPAMIGASTLVVPYDFDWSGVIGTRYARPDPSLPIHSVRERVWMSFCFTPADLAPAIAKFDSARAGVTALYTGNPLLDAKTAQGALAYFDAFYAVINDPKQLAKAIQRHCSG